MSDRIVALTSRVGSLRRERRWSQRELALRSGVSRAEVSAIETGRLSPSTATALRLAKALERGVEDLFSLAEDAGAEWAIAPRPGPGRFWEARVGPRRLLFPAEATALGVIPQDGTHDDRSIARGEVPDAGTTLVLAGCDPAVGLLASELRRESGLRVIALTRSTSGALDLLARGLVHAAGVHWSSAGNRDANAVVVASRLGAGFRLLHVARWQEGIAVAPSVSSRSIGVLARSRVRWAAREEGSGARRCLDRLLAGGRSAQARRRFRRFAFDHRGVAHAIKGGWAEAGIAVRLAAEEAGLDFIAVQDESYELCFSGALAADPAIAALRRALRQRSLRALYRGLPGYDVSRMGEERSVD